MILKTPDFSRKLSNVNDTFSCLTFMILFPCDVFAVLPATNVSRPLTVTPSPDMLALKLQQVAEKTVPASAESRLLRKVREQAENCSKRKPPGKDSAKVSNQ